MAAGDVITATGVNTQNNYSTFSGSGSLSYSGENKYHQFYTLHVGSNNVYWTKNKNYIYVYLERYVSGSWTNVASYTGSNSSGYFSISTRGLYRLRFYNSADLSGSYTYSAKQPYYPVTAGNPIKQAASDFSSVLSGGAYITWTDYTNRRLAE